MSEQTMWAVKSERIVWPSVRVTENEVTNIVVNLSGAPGDELQRRRKMDSKVRLEILAGYRVKKTARNSHIVWQILDASDNCVVGLPAPSIDGRFQFRPMGWRTKKLADAALDRMIELAERMAREEVQDGA